MNQQELAEELGTTQATVSRWLSGQEPRFSFPARFLFLARFSFLERIHRLARNKRLAQNMSIDDFIQPETISGFSDSGMSMRDTPFNNKKTGGDIAHLDLQKDQQNGHTLSIMDNNHNLRIKPEDQISSWAFPQHIKDQWKNIKQTYAMSVIGDAMEPTLTNGTDVFVDTTHRYPSPPDIYAINYGNGIMIKRLQILPKNIINIVSDNKSYADIQCKLNDLKVYGRVIASFKWSS